MEGEDLGPVMLDLVSSPAVAGDVLCMVHHCAGQVRLMSKKKNYIVQTFSAVIVDTVFWLVIEV